MLKRMFNESDESVVDRWKENPYWQYFCGEVIFQHHWPFDPTDTKLQKKIIEKCRDIANDEGIQLRQSYKRTLKQLMIDQRFREHPRRKKKSNAAARKIKTIAGRIVRDVERGRESCYLLSIETD